jgi:chaperone required for assembly of F1-ATPase
VCHHSCLLCQQGGFQVTLDGRGVRTPALLPLVVPTRALALAIAGEWEQQVCDTPRLLDCPRGYHCLHALQVNLNHQGANGDGATQDARVRPFTMPLMSLAATAIDQVRVGFG